MSIHKIFIADGNYLSREGLKSLIRELKDFSVCGEAENAVDFSVKLPAVNPDVLIIDPASSDFSVEQIFLSVQNRNYMPVLAITGHEPKTGMLEILDAGVTGYVLKECGKDEIIEAIQSTMRGEKFFCGKILEFLVHQNRGGKDCIDKNCDNCNPVRITDRELEIIRHIAEGLTNKEIADRLCISTHTVNTHRKNIMCKLGINNTAGIVMYAVRNNLLEPNRFLFHQRADSSFPPERQMSPTADWRIAQPN